MGLQRECVLRWRRHPPWDVCRTRRPLGSRSSIYAEVRRGLLPGLTPILQTLLAAFPHSSATLRTNTIQNARDYIRLRLHCAASYELHVHLAPKNYFSDSRSRMHFLFQSAGAGVPVGRRRRAYLTAKRGSSNIQSRWRRSNTRKTTAVTAPKIR